MVWDILVSLLLGLASLLPVEAWWVLAAIAYWGVKAVPIVGQYLPALYVALGIIFYGYVGEIYNKGWYDREAKYERVLNKKIKKEKSSWTTQSPGDKLKEYIKPTKKNKDPKWR